MNAHKHVLALSPHAKARTGLAEVESTTAKSLRTCDCVHASVLAQAGAIAQLLLSGAMLFVAGMWWGLDGPPSMWTHFTWWTWTLTAVFFFVGFYALFDRTYDYVWHVFAFTAVWAANWTVTLMAPILFVLAVHLVINSGLPLGLTLVGDRIEHVFPMLFVLVYTIARHSALTIPLTLRRGFWRHLGVHTTSENISIKLRVLSNAWVFIIAPLLPAVLYFASIDAIYVYGIVTAFPTLLTALAVIVSIAISLTSVFALRYVLRHAETLEMSATVLMTTVTVHAEASTPPPPAYTPKADSPVGRSAVTIRPLATVNGAHEIAAKPLRRP